MQRFSQVFLHTSCLIMIFKINSVSFWSKNNPANFWNKIIFAPWTDRSIWFLFFWKNLHNSIRDVQWKNKSSQGILNYCKSLIFIWIQIVISNSYSNKSSSLKLIMSVLFFKNSLISEKFWLSFDHATLEDVTLPILKK